MLEVAALWGVLATSPQELCRIAHPEINESSGLVALPDGGFVTTNDSGDSARLFVLDADCTTRRVVTWSTDAPVDVEALAPGTSGEVWVGDIGDNLARRDTISVTRVRLADAAATTYDLAYPDGAQDAEALLVDPRDQRVYVVTKNVFSGEVYAAPRRLDPDRVNALTLVGSAPGLVTDAAFLPGGREVLMRTYTTASVLTWPTLEHVDDFALPKQDQGEAVAIDAGGRILLSSEGVRAPLLALEARTSTSVPTATAATTPAESIASGPARPTPTAEPDVAAPTTPREPWPWLFGGLVALLAGGVLWRCLRPRL